MSKTIDMKEFEVASDQADSRVESYSISWLAEYFCRTPTWVKQRKSDLKEIWYWCYDDLFTESGSLTNRGFEKLQDLFDKTANSEIITTLQGKRKSKTKKAEMTPGEYRNYIWIKHRKSKPDEDDSLATDQDTAQEIEVVESEFVGTDVGSEIAENTAIVKHQVGSVATQNRQVFQSGLLQLKQALKQEIKRQLAPVAQEALSEVYSDLTDDIIGQMPQTASPTVKKVSKKKSV